MQVMAVMTAFPAFLRVLDSTKHRQIAGLPCWNWPVLRRLSTTGAAHARIEDVRMDSFGRNGSFQRDNDFDWEDENDPVVKRRREAAKAAEKEVLDDKLDVALEESFPGSDPISIIQPAQSLYEKSKF
jgi:hypothetical protein